VIANHPQKAALAMFAREISPSGTSWAPGTTSPGGGRPAVSPLIKPFAFTLAKAAVPVAFVLGGERYEIEIPAGVDGAAAGPATEPPPFEEDGSEQVEVRLIELAWARSGDKGNLSNIGVIARRAEWLPLIWARVTPEVVARYFGHLVHGCVERFHLPGIAAINYLLHDALDGGGPASTRMDPLGKGMAQMLLDLEIAVPQSLAASLAERP
jgi:hypothetical protein